MKKLLFFCITVLLLLVAGWFLIPSFKDFLYYQYFINVKREVVGGPCGPNCDGYMEYGDRFLSPVDTLPDFAVNDTNRIKLFGTIYKKDGRPASGVILYVFQANTSGIYPMRGDEKGAAKINGYLRGWIKTGKDGAYTLFTNIPGSYPGTKKIAHIHCVIKEANLNPYTLPNFVFPGDPNLTSVELNTPQDKNGGLVIPIGVDSTGLMVYKRDLFLGRGVINYPK